MSDRYTILSYNWLGDKSVRIFALYVAISTKYHVIRLSRYVQFPIIRVSRITQNSSIFFLVMSQYQVHTMICDCPVISQLLNLGEFILENLTFNAAGFGQYLLSNQLIPPGKESYFVHWVRLFFTEKKRWPDYPWSQQLDLFIKSLHDQSKLKDWQIHQADQAVRLYFVNFLKDKTEISPTICAKIS